MHPAHRDVAVAGRGDAVEARRQVVDLLDDPRVPQQAPGDGERWIAARLAQSAEEAVTGYTSRGMADPPATTVAGAFDAAMGDCILTFYRASAQPVRNTTAIRAATSTTAD